MLVPVERKMAYGKPYNYCKVCDTTVYHKLPHCTSCNEHHSKELSCEQTTLFLDADRQLGDLNP